MKKEVLVINYHAIVEDNDLSIQKSDALFSVTKTLFEKHIQILKQHKISVISLKDFISNAYQAEFSVIITVDDGNPSDYLIVYPFLKSQCVPATFFLLSGSKASQDSEKIKEMIGNGFSIGSHGVTHRAFTELDDSQQWYELERSKKQLEEKTGNRVDFFAFPYGSYTLKNIELVKKAGYTAALTTDLKLNSDEGFSFLIHRWNVKRNTTPEEFEHMLINRNFLDSKIKRARIKKTAKNFLGRKVADSLNQLFNS